MTKYEMSRVTSAYLALIESWSGSDQDQDLDLDQDLNVINKDQIRSDLDQGNNVETKFRMFAAKHGIDLEDVELSTIERNMFWFVNNIESVRYPAAYIRKMVRDCCVRKKIGFQPTKPAKQESEESEVTEVYGYDVEILDQWAVNLDNDVYISILAALPPTARVLFPSLSKVLETKAKTRVFIAEGIKRGVI
ncbi:MAG: hypothetical protein WCR98_09065 [Saccharofermentanales bacterium]